MTPEKIIELGEPVEHVYNCMVDELMTNCAIHLRGATWTALHELETLENLGQLTKENAEIINYWAKMITPEMRSTMKHARDEALKEIEKKLAKAAKDGYVPKPLNDTSFDAIKAYYEQAVDKLNMVNTTMLQSSLQLYQSGAAKYKTVTAQNFQMAQNTMNEEVGYVESGAKTRQEAMRDAIRFMASQGVTGFYDRAGRAWNAEAYVAMDMRTTIHNSMIAAVQARQEDYGTSVFQVSAHAGARPLCYPYQGKLYSWDNTAGDFPTGEGQKIHYAPLNTTSYGLPAGLFGINCGHTPYPMIPNVSIPADEEIQSPEENEKAYAESQKQRALERQIRYAKRDLEMLGSLATEEDKKRLAMAQANMRAFCAETGRARRYDREQIYTTFKADNNPPPPSSNPPSSPPNNPPMSPPLQQAVKEAKEAGYTVVTNREEAIAQLETMFGSVTTNTLKNTDEDLLVENVNRISELNEMFGVLTDQNKYDFIARKNSNSGTYAYAAYRWTPEGKYNRELYINNKYFESKETIISSYIDDLKSKWHPPTAKEYYSTAVLTHEYGHALETTILFNRYDFSQNATWEWRSDRDKMQADIRKEIIQIAERRGSDVDADCSRYGKKNDAEFFAEAFCNAFCGERNKLGDAMIEWLGQQGFDNEAFNDWKEREGFE